MHTGQLNPLFHTFAEFRHIVNGVVVRQSADWLADNAQFSPSEILEIQANNDNKIYLKMCESRPDLLKLLPWSP